MRELIELSIVAICTTILALEVQDAKNYGKSEETVNNHKEENHSIC